MFMVKCRHCGQAYYVTGLTKEQWEELNNKNPDTCGTCGELI